MTGVPGLAYVGRIFILVDLYLHDSSLGVFQWRGRLVPLLPTASHS
jgi:hypothetical protein